MKKSLLLFISLALLGSCTQSSSDSENQSENPETNPTPPLAQFVALDQAYIPPLFFTSVENLAASRASFARLQQEWTTFQAANTQLFKDPEWTADLEKIDQHVQEAGAIIHEGQALKLAHEELEYVREILLKARQRNNFDYFVDYLTAFHEPMETIVLTAKQTPPEKWTPETTALLQSALPEAEVRWQGVENAAFQPADYGFNEKRYQQMKQLIAAETQALAQFKNALEQQVPIPQLRKSAMGIKPNFAGLFKLFGNIEDYQNPAEMTTPE